MQTPHRTPLRRISQGSLLRLSRSGAYPDAPHGLGFLEPAMSEFVDETETLQTNVEGLNHLSDTLATFNESFASWLYVMNMNALTVDWPQAPHEGSFMLAKRRTERDALAAMEALQAQAEAKSIQPSTSEGSINDETTVVDPKEGSIPNSSQNPGSAKTTKKVVKGKKTKLTAKEKKERALELERIITFLPLEFRGNDPTLRRNMEAVIEGIWDAPNQTIKLPDLIKPPDLNQARANKCLIALVNRKVVQKDSSTGTVLYHWRGLA
ncbi:DASH complex subunit Dam1-domain-containing protein [Lentinula raphanica]|uniref:DASH complex subunit DAM1 n=1 Tax=Lentinula raphanica TaxID=153919 RepID=A0AA38PM62_9AGAR|nr:DASH complex subunit Dam1-domain-containing protein [Lentinula raphanica]KAJ3754219.1 DASH complex subunit Dam1-domain-containing protein [Lentinula raphanica]KAJ3773684.1 DASH complex subunit Dam1-domain-containing protein [Lentinula raphanica]KAJ3830302.1 DASH complex subunit Dam1-domain-containing protein [Lentinula raphanica]KAJ3845528.1 DASH complex subunit Dam1-domain-containing protein [Lentinula raphanica]